MYYLPNNIAIDIVGIIEGMIDDDTTVTYFFDSKTGDVVGIENGKSAPEDTTRYFGIPRIHSTSKEKWMKEFMREFLYGEDRRQVQKLKEIFEYTGVKGVCEYLEGYDATLLDAWHEWEGDCAFERLDDWFLTLPVTIEERWHGDDDCAVCRAMRDGVEGDELLDAFAEQNESNKIHGYAVPLLDKKDIHTVEAILQRLIGEYKLEDRLSVEIVKEWILNESGDPMQANKEYIAKWDSFFDPSLSDYKYQIIMDAFTDAWNYFPHKSLGGKSPQEMLESRQ